MSKYFKKLSLLLAVVMLVTMQFTFALATDEEQNQVISAPDMTGQIVVLHTNDVHSRIDDNLGYTAVKAWKDYYESLGATVVLLEAGDVLHGFPIANFGQGENIVELMNAAGYTAMTPGNHDFNYGTKRLIELESMMEFDLLSANFTSEEGKAVFAPSKLYELDGVKIGIVGVSTPETATKTNPLNVIGYTFNDTKMAELVQAEVDALELAGAEYIIALCHLGVDESSAPLRSTDLIAATEGIDLVVDGHSHTKLENGQIVKNKAGEDVVLAQTGNYVAAIGKVVIDTDGSIKASLIEEEKIDEAVSKLATDMRAEIQPLLETVVAKTDVNLNGERAPGVRTQETNLGDLAADALKYVSGADVALTNGGGIRVSIEVGNITYGDLNAVFPFGNVVVTTDVTGAEILAALEHGTKDCPEASGGFPQIAGMTFKLNTALTENRVSDVMIGDVPLDLEKTYSLATNDFTQVGGDGYTMLAGPKTGEYGALDEALVKYIEEALKGTVGEEYAEAQGRIKIVHEEPEVTTEAALGFADLTAQWDWANPSIEKVVDAKLFFGVSDTEFAPKTSMTRGMVAAVLSRYSQVESAYTESSFADVDLEQWYGQATEWAYQTSIVAGMGNNAEGKAVFMPNKAITREQLAVMIANYCRLRANDAEKVTNEVSFTDKESISGWAEESIKYCVAKGFFSGYPDGTFAPQKLVSRAEVAVILDKVMTEFDKVESDEKTESEVEQ